MKPETKDMLGRSALTAVAEAQRIFLSHLPDHVQDTEQLPLLDALGRVTACDVIATENLPATPRSCMDGYALIARDSYGASESMPAYIEVKGEVLMGQIPEGQVSKGSCYKIPTGGVVPAGADSVVMFEHTVPIDESLIEVVRGVGEGANVSQTGEDIAQGSAPIARGTLLRPQDLGLLAGLGRAKIEVFRKPRVAIMSTGDEIIAHDAALSPGKIRNINSIALASQAMVLGAEVQDYGIIADDFKSFLEVIEQATKENDIVLFSGGSSVGMRDLGEQIIEKLGPPGVLIHGTKLKPGKPVILGMSGHTAVVGLPGHPVSAMTCFDMFIAPAIAQLSGQHQKTYKPGLTATLERNINSAPGRKDVVRVEIREENGNYFAKPVLGKSGSISVLSDADGYFIIDEPNQGASEGDTLQVFLY